MANLAEGPKEHERVLVKDALKRAGLGRRRRRRGLGSWSLSRLGPGGGAATLLLSLHQSGRRWGVLPGRVCAGCFGTGWLASLRRLGGTGCLSLGGGGVGGGGAKALFLVGAQVPRLHALEDHAHLEQQGPAKSFKKAHQEVRCKQGRAAIGRAKKESTQ